MSRCDICRSVGDVQQRANGIRLRGCFVHRACLNGKSPQARKWAMRVRFGEMNYYAYDGLELPHADVLYLAHAEWGE